MTEEIVFETIKSEAEIIDYGIDWTDELILSSPADIISSSAWVIDDPAVDVLTLGTNTIEGNITFCRVSDGGRDEIVHYLINRIITASGQKFQRTIEITMRER